MGQINKTKRILLKVIFEYQNKRHFFNLLSAFWYAVCPFLKQYGKPRHGAILKYLIKQDGIKELVKEYAKKVPNHLQEISPDCPIWVMWWQGYSPCPPIVKKCIASIKRNAQSHPVYLLTKENYRDYIDVPVEIEEKVLNTKCIAYMSDIIRFGLLSKRGGIWLDATIYVSRPITSWPMPLYSIRHSSKDPRYVLDGFRWSSFMVASVPNEVMPTFVYKALLDYFSKHDALIDYFLTDYLIAMIYLNNNNVKKQIDALPEDNIGTLQLLMNLSKPYDKERLKKMLNARKFHKLDWRHNITDKDSMYAHLK